MNACAIVDLLKTEEALTLEPETLQTLPVAAKLKLFYNPKVITLSLNRTFEKAHLDIR